MRAIYVAADAQLTQAVCPTTEGGTRPAQSTPLPLQDIFFNLFTNFSTV